MGLVLVVIPATAGTGNANGESSAADAGSASAGGAKGDGAKSSGESARVGLVLAFLVGGATAGVLVLILVLAAGVLVLVLADAALAPVGLVAVAVAVAGVLDTFSIASPSCLDACACTVPHPL